MALKGKKWITCTPVAFRGDEQTFFSRDSGLCCRTLQALGAEAKVVMPEPAWDDESDVLRAPYARLCDPDFWREQAVDAVILYSWADPRYTPVAEAILQSGTRLYLNMDTGGLMSPFVEPVAYARSIWMAECQRHGVCRGALRAAVRLAGSVIRLDRHFSRLRHMNCADVIGVVSPVGAERVRKYARFFGRRDIAAKVQFVSHPIDSTLRYTGCPKEPVVIAVGRWNDSVKRPDVMCAVAASVLAGHPSVRWVIAGKEAVRCAEQIAAHVPFAKERITGYERLDHDRLGEALSSAMISLCTSRSEGYHTVSAEALLCGCSVVSPASPYLPSLPYFVDEGRSGRLSADSPKAIAEAVLAELAAWQRGERDPWRIARTWRERVGAEVAIRRVDELLFGEGASTTAPLE